MVIPFELLVNVIILIIALVIIIILLTYALKFYFFLKARSDQRTSNRIEDYLTTAASAHKTISSSDFPRSWRHLDLILPLLFEMDKKIQNPYWPQIKESVARSVLLPIARDKYKSHRWMNRLLSAQCFELAMEDQDEAIVSTLLEDNIPLVHLHAVIAAIKYSSPTLINVVINDMSKKRRLGQSVYLKIFDMTAPQTRQYVEDRLKTENDPFIRATCYKILLTYPQAPSTLDTSVDINSSNLELRLSALRYTTYTNKDNSIPLLISLLTDPHWEVRATSNRLLGDLHATQAIKEITGCLRDPVWWVRVNAANTLKNFGESGIEILNAQDPSLDLYAYETAMHVLNKPIT